jgi:hypothetical protein
VQNETSYSEYAQNDTSYPECVQNDKSYSEYAQNDTSYPKYVQNETFYSEYAQSKWHILPWVGANYNKKVILSGNSEGAIMFGLAKTESI